MDTVDIGAHEIGLAKVIDVAIRGKNTADGEQGLYSIPTGSGIQLRTVPIGGAEKIEVRFSNDVDPATLANALMLEGANAGDYTTDMVFQSYDSATNRAVWEYTPGVSDDHLPTNQMVLTLKDSITNTHGIALDGNGWVNLAAVDDTTTSGLSVLTLVGSGDGNVGGDFEFNFTILIGDIDIDNEVNGDDFNLLSFYFTQSGLAFLTANIDGVDEVGGDDFNLLAFDFTTDFTTWP